MCVCVWVGERERKRERERERESGEDGVAECFRNVGFIGFNFSVYGVVVIVEDDEIIFHILEKYNSGLMTEINHNIVNT